MHITNLGVSRDGISLISDVNLVLAPGDICVLSGANGAGKSTLVYALMGHPKYQITGGSITFEGVGLTHAAPEVRARAGIFLAIQNPMPLPGITWYAFLKESLQAIKGQYFSAEQFQENVFPVMDALALDRAWLQRGVHEGFSGGERKRFEVLHALVVQPKVLFLDEIDSGLDPHACSLVGKALAQFHQDNPQSAMLIITHTKALLSYLQPTHWCQMESGRLTAQSGHV